MVMPFGKDKGSTTQEIGDSHALRETEETDQTNQCAALAGKPLALALLVTPCHKGNPYAMIPEDGAAQTIAGCAVCERNN